MSCLPLLFHEHMCEDGGAVAVPLAIAVSFTLFLSWLCRRGGRCVAGPVSVPVAFSVALAVPVPVPVAFPITVAIALSVSVAVA